MNDKSYGYFCGGQVIKKGDKLDELKLPETNLSIELPDFEKLVPSYIKPVINYSHICDGQLPSSGFGEAITYCMEYDDGLWVGNGEYASQVNYCPYCGYKAKIQIDE